MDYDDDDDDYHKAPSSPSPPTTTTTTTTTMDSDIAVVEVEASYNNQNFKSTFPQKKEIEVDNIITRFTLHIMASGSGGR